MAARRSLGRKVRRLLGTLFVFSGLSILWLALRGLDGRIITRNVRKYFAELQAHRSKAISERHFPLSYFKEQLHIGMDVADVEKEIVGAKRYATFSSSSNETTVQKYRFGFGFLGKHELIVILDRDSRVIGVDANHLSFDLRNPTTTPL